MYSLQLVTPPLAEPVSLATTKEYLSVDVGFTDDDQLISSFITAARQAAEDYTNRAFFDQTWRLSLDHFPMLWDFSTIKRNGDANYPFEWFFDAQTIRLPKPGCVSVNSITYVDQANTTQTLDPSVYFVDKDSEPARILPYTGVTWPVAQIYLPGNVKITFQAGTWGDGVTVNNCPGNVSTAIALLAAWLYSNREGAAPIPQAFYTLLDSVKFETFGMGY